MGSSKAPAAPDYVGAATVQGAANKEAALTTGKVNNPTVYNPYGSQEVTWNGDQPTVTQRLGQAEQQLKDTTDWAKQESAGAGKNLAHNIRANSEGHFRTGEDVVAPGSLRDSDTGYAQYAGTGRVNEGLGAVMAKTGRMDAKQVDSSQKYRDDVINAMMGRVDIGTKKQREQENSRLIAAGLRPGTEAYREAMDSINRGYNDARQQAIISGGSEASRSEQMDIAARQQRGAELSLNENLNAQDYQAGLQRRTAQQQALQTNAGLNLQDFNAQLANKTFSNQGIAQNNANTANVYAMKQDANKNRIANALAQRNQPINEMISLQQGQQVNNPFAGGLGYQAGANVAPAPVAQGVQAQGQAAQNQYNAQQASRNANIGAGAGLIGSIGSAAMYR